MDRDREANTRCTWFTKIGYVHGVEEFSLIVKGLHKYIDSSSPLGLREMKSTSISLQLADRSITYPRGIIEDVLVRVDQFLLPGDFLVLDMEEDREIPIILGVHLWLLLELLSVEPKIITRRHVDLWIKRDKNTLEAQWDSYARVAENHLSTK
ncbi:hypothetical protein DVH24_030425 [Malus domestica]|uniref:Uncharacterized protein n=1 Tax=Malus domestica TaxID=3750 RepID=A0A498K1Y3_MALDO|nr:hypothetical protein DVH24_030425 [Malus domestica]